MTTSATLNVPLRSAGQLLGTLAVAISDRDMSVDAAPGALTITPGAGTWRLRCHVTSTPAVGSGTPITASVDATLTAGQTMTLAAPASAHHRFKDFEGGGSDRRIIAAVELLRNASGSFKRVGVGTATYTYAAPPAARTDQVYALQNQSLIASVDAPAASALQGAFDLMADVLQPIAGHPERTLWKFPALWALLETARGTYDTAGYVAFLDTLFGYAQARGIGVYAMLGSAPPTWTVSSATYGTASITVRGTTYTYVKGGQAPDSWTDLTDMVTWFVNRYQPLGLKVVGMPNEPNGSLYSVTAAQWASYMSHIYDAVKAAQPTVEVHAPQLAMGDTAYMDSLYSSGAFAGKYDKIAWHPYPLTTSTQREMLGNFVYDQRVPMPGLEYPDSPMAAGSFIDSVLAHDSGARFWVAETGIATGITPAGATTRWSVPESRQGDQWTYVLRGLARVPLIDGVTILDLLDESTSRSPNALNYGLVRNDRVSKKPGYAAVKAAIAAIRGGTG